MPRNRRLNIPGSVYHVITRGYERKEIFLDQEDKKAFIERLKCNLRKSQSQCLAWVLMSNHVHLLIRHGVDSLSSLMKRILTGYAIYFNHKNNRQGYLFQNRFKSILCQEEKYLFELVRYIHLNPLKASLVKTMDQLDEYPWCGHSVLMGRQKNDWQEVNDILSRFGRSRKEAINRYREFVVDGTSRRSEYDFSGGGLRRSVGGWKGVEIIRRNKDFWRGDERILGDNQFVEDILKQSDQKLALEEEVRRKDLNIEGFVNGICRRFSISFGQITKKGRNNSVQRARDVVSYWGVNKLNFKRKEVMRILKISQPGLTKAIQRGEQAVKDLDLKLLS